MDRKALLIAVIATAAGIALLRLYMHRFEQQAGGGPKQLVLVLLGDAAAGTVISGDALGTRLLPQAYLESRHIPARQLNEVVGLRLALSVRAHDALLWTDLASMRPAPRTLASLVPPGMRALSLSLRAGAFDALLAPGDRVDVLLAPERSADPVASTVAENLLVLAIGDQLARAGSGTHARSGDVTLSVSPEQSRTLAAAERRGGLRLVLRHPDDITLGAGSAPSSTGAQAPDDSRVPAQEGR
ncbi:MAG TPA: Flp pilus assembly protein CpaB [Polyangiales bacterium]|nr:Flp pilus assembly protein CpaB [Polyangiales bacterium]